MGRRAGGAATGAMASTNANADAEPAAGATARAGTLDAVVAADTCGGGGGGCDGRTRRGGLDTSSGDTVEDLDGGNGSGAATPTAAVAANGAAAIHAGDEVDGVGRDAGVLRVCCEWEAAAVKEDG